MDTVTRIQGLLPEGVRRQVGELPKDLTELRMRAEQSVELVSLKGERLCGEPITASMVRQTAQSLAGHSLYAREEELTQGYFTISGGCRVGVCGRMSGEHGTLTHIGSLCIRIARPIHGVANPVMNALYEQGRPVSALIISAPALGKTTLLRDIVRQMSDGTEGRRGVRIGVADERGELAGCDKGVPTLDVGCRTDVIDGCSKREGMRRLLRSMSPQVIVTDELGHPEDAEAVQDILRAGVRVIASIHARDEQEAARRLGRCSLALFERFIVLGDDVGRVKRISNGKTEGFIL